ncbi:hypothetical protein RJT34_16218 [Clitoria ternatea]|uniref:Uncharacterized protein n=1 Tax=Clitoria ternatea TaxID=43366 RepID=A0AAN9J6T5_CLITE
MLLNGRLDNPVIAVGSYSICMVLLGISTAIRPLMHLSTVIMLGQTDFLKRFLVSQGCIKRLCDLPIYPDPRILTVCLEGLENILKSAEEDETLPPGDASQVGSILLVLLSFLLCLLVGSTSIRRSFGWTALSGKSSNVTVKLSGVKSMSYQKCSKFFS